MPNPRMLMTCIVAASLIAIQAAGFPGARAQSAGDGSEADTTATQGEAPPNEPTDPWAAGESALDDSLKTTSPPDAPTKKGCTAQRMFRIERNKNANIVIYDAQIHDDGTLDEKDPVIVYWIKLAEDNRIEGLKRVEKKFAYGISAKRTDPHTATVEMKAKIDREITVKLVDGEYKGVARVDGKDAYLEYIWIESIEKKPMPSVEYLELYGTDVETGEQRYEKYVP